MPAIGPNSTILITGITGYLGGHAVQQALTHGHKVIGVVRKAEQGDWIAAKYPGQKFSYLVVPDMEVEGAYDEAVKGVDGVIHMAAPVTFTFVDPQDHIAPAINGVLGILKSASKPGSTVKRIATTSSALAVNFDPPKEPTVLNETMWDEFSPAHIVEKGKDSNPWAVYSAEKTLAEQAAWKYMKDTKPHFDLVTILPSYNWGPWIHDVPSKEKLGTTLGVFNYMIANPDDSGTRTGDFVDARDTALIHLLALETEAAGGERILNSNEPFSWQEVYDILNERGYPNIPKGNPGKDAKNGTRFDNSKSLKIFPGLKYRSLKESIGDMGALINEKGWF